MCEIGIDKDNDILGVANDKSIIRKSNIGCTTWRKLKQFLLKRARQEIDRFHESRLGLNENVSGSMMYLFNSERIRKGGTWSNEQTTMIRTTPQVLGKVKTLAELNRLSEAAVRSGEAIGKIDVLAALEDLEGESNKD